MPTIVFASPKGGVGKSTAAVLLATELAGFGAGVLTHPKMNFAFCSLSARIPVAGLFTLAFVQ
jgi:hypothetical protein